MELRHLPLMRAAAAERQLMQQHQPQRAPLAAVPAFYPSTIVPAGGQGHILPVTVLSDRCGLPVLPAQSAATPVYPPAAPISSDFRPQISSTGLKSRENPSPDDVRGRVPVPDSSSRLTLTGSGSTTPLKRHLNTNSFSIERLLATREKHDQLSSRTLDSRTLEVRKSVADQLTVDVDAGTRQPTVVHRMAAGHRPVSPACPSIAPVTHMMPGCTHRLGLVTWF